MLKPHVWRITLLSLVLLPASCASSYYATQMTNLRKDACSHPSFEGGALLDDCDAHPENWYWLGAILLIAIWFWLGERILKKWRK